VTRLYRVIGCAGNHLGPLLPSVLWFELRPIQVGEPPGPCTFIVHPARLLAWKPLGDGVLIYVNGEPSSSARSFNPDIGDDLSVPELSDELRLQEGLQ